MNVDKLLNSENVLYLTTVYILCPLVTCVSLMNVWPYLLFHTFKVHFHQK